MDLLFVQIGSILQSETLNLTTVWPSNIVPAEIVDILRFVYILGWIYQLLSLFSPGQHCSAILYKIWEPISILLFTLEMIMHSHSTAPDIVKR